MAMKVHSFLRETFARALKQKQNLAYANQKVILYIFKIFFKYLFQTENDAELNTSSDWVTLQQYIYFLFAPTFIYRDNYPK